MLDHEGHGHKAVVYKSHFLPLRHSVVTETPADTLANKPRLTKDTHSLFFMPPRHILNNFNNARIIISIFTPFLTSSVLAADSTIKRYIGA